MVIIGGGPAAISAAIWCADLNLNAVLIEKGTRIGGQLHSIYNRIRNYPGIDAENGAALAEMFSASLDGFQHRKLLECAAVEIDAAARSVTLTDGRTINGRAVIVATGVRRRTLNVPGESDFTGCGLVKSASEDRSVFRGQQVVVIGGGDAAAENALIVAASGGVVTLIHRGPKLSAREEFQEKLAAAGVNILLSTVVEEFCGALRLTEIRIRNEATRERSNLAVDLALVRIGVVPNSEILRGVVTLDARGYAVVDANCQTSSAHIYAVGDLANPAAPTISTAAGTAATACKSIRRAIGRT